MQLILKIESSPIDFPSMRASRAWITDGRTMTVGRVSGDLVVRDPEMSSEHFQVACDGTTCTLTDLDSTNGTFVNDTRVRSARLRAGDMIRAGKTKFAVQIVGVAEAVAAPTDVLESADAESPHMVEAGPDLIRSSAELPISADTAPASRDDEPVRIFNSTQFEFALLPGRVQYPGYSLTVVVKGTFDLKHGKVVTVAEEQQPVTGDLPFDDAEDELAAPRYESDIAFFKPRADLLLSGSCYVPDGKPSDRCDVEFRVQNYKRSLTVFGDRRWGGFMGAKASEPRPFTQMELRYERSYGGAGYDKNPTGRGYVKIQATEGNLKLPLPNIEDKRRHLETRVQTPEPAGFGPLSKHWPQRKSMLGTYDDAWLKERWPWFAADFNWGYFNAAPFEMQTGYLNGDEEIYLENLHPETPEFNTRLAGTTVRCFVYEVRENDERRLRELTMQLDTLWVDTDAQQVVLVWRGVAAVASEDLNEIRSVYFMEDNVSQKQSSEVCLAAFRKARSDWEAEWETEDEPIEGFEDVEQPPPEYGPSPTDDDMVVATKEAESMAELRASMESAGIDPDNPPKLTLEEKQRAIAYLKEQGVEWDEEQVEEREPWTRERVIEHAAAGESFEGEDLRELDLSGLELAGCNFSEANLTDADLSGSDLTATHFQSSKLSRANLTSCKLTAAVLDDATLTAADLAKAYGEDPSFEGADLCAAKLLNSQLSFANFSQSKLVEADLKGAEFRQAIFASADLSKALLVHAALIEADFTEATLSNADLRKVNVEGAVFTGAKLSRAKLEGCVARSALFDAASLRNVVLSGSDLTEADFTGAKLHHASFQHCVMCGVSLEEAEGLNTDFCEAVLTEAKAAECKFPAGKFARVQAADSTWEGSVLNQSNWSYAVAPGADFSAVSFVRATLRAADLRGADFGEAKLAEANLEVANLFEGNFEKADLTEANLRKASLFGAELQEAVLSSAELDDANLKRSSFAMAQTDG